MKKICSIAIVLVMLIVLAGCKSKTQELTCTSTTKGNNMNADTSVTYTFEDDKLSKADLEVVFKDISVANLDTVWESFKTQFTNQNKPVEIDGFKRTVKADDEKHTFSISMEIDYSKISKDTMKKYQIDDFKNKSYNEVKKMAVETDKMTCK